MTRRFIEAKPLQACKLAASVVVLVITIGAVFNPLPGNGWEIFLLAPATALGLALIVTGETLVAVYRAVRSDGRLTDRLAARPLYALVRATEALVPLVATAGFFGWVSTLYIGPEMAGPGAIFILFVILALGGLVLVTTLVRTLVEYRDHRRSQTA